MVSRVSGLDPGQVLLGASVARGIVSRAETRRRASLRSWSFPFSPDGHLRTGPVPGSWIGVSEESLRQDPASRPAANPAAPLRKSRLLAIVLLPLLEAGSYPTLVEIWDRPILVGNPRNCHNLATDACHTTHAVCGPR